MEVDSESSISEVRRGVQSFIEQIFRVCYDRHCEFQKKSLDLQCFCRVARQYKPFQEVSRPLITEGSGFSGVVQTGPPFQHLELVAGGNVTAASAECSVKELGNGRKLGERTLRGRPFKGFGSLLVKE